MFYTYLWLREDGTPYYVGKGAGIRAYRKHRMGSPPPKHRILVQHYPCETDAFAAEMFLIAYYGREDKGAGRLLNMTDGGENPPSHKGVKRSEETCKKLSAWKRPPELGRKISAGIKAFYAADISLIGKRFGKLVVVSREGVDTHHDALWKVLCDCGKHKTVIGANMKRGYTKSCGCLSTEHINAYWAARKRDKNNG